MTSLDFHPSLFGRLILDESVEEVAELLGRLGVERAEPSEEAHGDAYAVRHADVGLQLFHRPGKFGEGVRLLRRGEPLAGFALPYAVVDFHDLPVYLRYDLVGRDGERRLHLLPSAVLHPPRHGLARGADLRGYLLLRERPVEEQGLRDVLLINVSLSHFVYAVLRLCGCAEPIRPEAEKHCKYPIIRAFFQTAFL